MTKGKPWSADEEKRLRALVMSGVSVRGVAKAMGKTLESVQTKMMRLGLAVEGEKICSVPSSSPSSSMPDIGSDIEKLSSKSPTPVLVWPEALEVVFAFSQDLQAAHEVH